MRAGSGRWWLSLGLLVTVLIASCGKKDENQSSASGAGPSPTACDEPIDWFINRTVDSLQNQEAAQGNPVSREKAMAAVSELKKLLLRRCKEDGWSKPVLDCVQGASKQNDIHACKKDMTAAQRERFQKEASKLLPLVVGAKVMPGPNQSIGIGVRNMGDMEWHAAHVCVNERWCTKEQATVKPGGDLILMWYVPGQPSDFLNQSAANQSSDPVRTLSVISEEGSWIKDY